MQILSSRSSPFPPNFKALRKNVELNSHLQRAEVVLANKAVAGERGRSRIFASLEGVYVGTGTARLEDTPKGRHLEYVVDLDTLDNILNELNVERVNLLRINVEGYALKSLTRYVKNT